MSETLRCTVIVPARNREPLLRHTLGSLVRQRLPRDQFEVLVIDDQSTDGTPGVAEQFGAQLNLRYLRLAHRSPGPGQVRNVGIRSARGEVCVFVDAGVVLSSGCLLAHLATHDQADEPTAVCGYVHGLDVDDTHNDEMSRDLDPTDPDRTIDSLRRNRRWPDVREEFYDLYGDDIEKLPAPWVIYWTACASALTSQLRMVGMFDEAFRGWGGEDLDLGYRLHRAGNRIVLNRDAAAMHLPHPSDFEAHMASAADNYQYMVDKYDTPEIRLLATIEPERFFELNNVLIRTGGRSPGPVGGGAR